ncbi:MAG: hypothetical protein ACI4M5_02920 [Christensenellales bacterium]
MKTKKQNNVAKKCKPDVSKPSFRKRDQTKVSPNFDFAMGANTVYKTNKCICAQKVIQTDKKGKATLTEDKYFRITPARAKAFNMLPADKKARYETKAKSVSFCK